MLKRHLVGLKLCTLNQIVIDSEKYSYKMSCLNLNNETNCSVCKDYNRLKRGQIQILKNCKIHCDKKQMRTNCIMFTDAVHRFSITTFLSKELFVLKMLSIFSKFVAL